MATATETVVTCTTTAENWRNYRDLAAKAAAARKAADAAWALLGLPEDGKAWATLAGLASGQTAKVVVCDGNGTPLAAGVISERENPPRPASISWVSPRL